jgi:hypothetical protein
MIITEIKLINKEIYSLKKTIKIFSTEIQHTAMFFHIHVVKSRTNTSVLQVQQWLDGTSHKNKVFFFKSYKIIQCTAINEIQEYAGRISRIIENKQSISNFKKSL